MNASLHVHRLTPLFLVCFCVALVPSLSIWYFILLTLFVKAFVIVCVVDHIRKTTMRKNLGAIVAVMILAAISSLVVLYFKGWQ